MTSGDPLDLHRQLCDEIHACVLEENRFLRQHQRVPEAALGERKRALLGRLDESLAALRALPAAAPGDQARRDQLEKTRSRILQILQLDKENEQLLLKFSLAGTKPAAPAPPMTASLAMLQKIYSRNS
jgi:hypothetical protein